MQRPNRRLPWFLLPGLAFILLGVHAAFLRTVSNHHATALVADLLQIGLGIIIALVAVHAAKHAAGFTQTFWRFQACGFSIWVLAQMLATVYDAVLHKPVDQPWPSDLLFFMWTTPIFLALFLNERCESQRIEWPQWLDFTQVVILVASAFVFAFEVPSHWRGSVIPFEQLALLASCVRDVFLVACFAFRTFNARDPQVRSLFGRIALFLTVYSLAECPYLYLQVYERLRPGTLLDLPWSAAFVLGTFLIATAPSADVRKVWLWRERKKSHPILRALLKIVPLVFPMAVLLMAAHIAEQQFAIAAAAVLASFACSIIGIVLAERKQLRSDAALQDKNALLKSVFEGTGDAIFVKDKEGRYLIVNKAVANFFEQPIEKIIGKTAFDLTDAESARKLTANDKMIMETGETITVDLQTPLDGSMEYFLVTRAPYRDNNGKIIGIIGISRNISKYKEIEDRLRQSQKMEAIGTLAGGVAHDFNNILMVINGYSSVLSEALKDEPRLRSHVEQIQKSGDRAASLTRQLLAFSRKQTVQPSLLSLNEVVNGIATLLRRLIGEDIIISTTLDPNIGMVMADSGQMEQMLLNLAVNSRDAMPEGGKLSIETRVSTLSKNRLRERSGLESGQYAELIVTDTGTGMSPAIQAHVFEPFFTTKPAGKGTGLGLSTVYGIVQQAGGYITFHSSPGAGTRFEILLPQVTPIQHPARSEEERADRLAGGETVLLVEDDESVCNLVKAVLISQGYSVLAAKHPREAETIGQVHAKRIQLLLTDVVMPEMNGAELSRRLAAFHPQLKVLFMSGYIDDSVVREEIRERGIAYLQKPFSPTTLAKKIREILDAVPVAGT